jgi:hypothetical protein
VGEGNRSPAQDKIVLKPSKAYKRVRALLQDPPALLLFGTKALAPPTGPGDRATLLHDLASLNVMLGWRDLSDLLLKAKFVLFLRPLLVHCVEWLEVDQFQEQGPRGRQLLKLLMGSVLHLTTQDVEVGAGFAVETGILPRLKQLLPWKKPVPLDLEKADILGKCVHGALCLVTIGTLGPSIAATLGIYANFEAYDVAGWQQELLVWAASAWRANPDARAPLLGLLEHVFTAITAFLQMIPYGPADLGVFSRAEELAADIKAGVSTWPASAQGEARRFLECLRKAKALRGGGSSTGSGGGG